MIAIYKAILILDVMKILLSQKKETNKYSQMQIILQCDKMTEIDVGLEFDVAVLLLISHVNNMYMIQLLRFHIARKQHHKASIDGLIQQKLVTQLVLCQYEIYCTKLTCYFCAYQ